jgi:DNA-binding HxlR family transcriptional regulator
MAYDDKIPDRLNAVDCDNCVPEFSPEVEALTIRLLGNIADKWTMLVLEELAGGQPKRHNVLRDSLPGISQKMLTQTLRQMEQLGLVTRTIHPVVPPHVEYQSTQLGNDLGKVVCQVWNWVAANAEAMEAARKSFKERAATEAALK